MLTRRFLGKVSEDNPIEGVKNLLAVMTGKDPSEIHLSEEMIQNISQQQQEKMEIKKIINPFYDILKAKNNRENKKKILELIDLGKFIYYAGLENEIKIIECSEKPDFIIRVQENLVGVEHTGIYDDSIVAEIKSFKKILKKCEEKLKIKQPDILGLYNIIVIPSKLKELLPFKEEEIIQSICHQIIAINEQGESEPTSFIARIVYTSHPIMELTMGEDYWLAELNLVSTEKTISKKEKKIATYRKEKGMLVADCYRRNKFGLKLCLTARFTSYEFHSF